MKAQRGRLYACSSGGTGVRTYRRLVACVLMEKCSPGYGGWNRGCRTANTRRNGLRGIPGVPPQTGLYAACVGMFAYAIFGTSRQLAVTSASSSAAMLAALVAPLALADSTRYTMLASAASIAAGGLFLLGGVLKLGAVSEFISKPVLKGFVFGLALTIIAKQAHKILGISSGQGNFFHQSWHVLTALADVNPWTLGIGAAALLTMFSLGFVAPKVPSVLVVLVLAILSFSWFGLDRHRVEVVGTIRTGMPTFGLAEGGRG